MKIAGIVAEYNPFHNGHAFHIEETRKNIKKIRNLADRLAQRVSSQ